MWYVFCVLLGVACGWSVSWLVHIRQRDTWRRTAADAIERAADAQRQAAASEPPPAPDDYLRETAADVLDRYRRGSGHSYD